jgi:hypothetical protein
MDWELKSPKFTTSPTLPISLIQHFHISFNSFISLTQKDDEMVKLSPDIQNFLQLMKTIHFTGQNVVVSHYSKIFSIDWHTDTSQLLLSTGDKNGNIGTCRFFVIS